jgi:hypothetical protein
VRGNKEMRTEIRTSTETEKIMFGYWDDDVKEFYELRDSISDEEMAKAAEKLGCSPVLINALIMLTDNIVVNVGKDLKDIWKRLDKIEGR